MDAGEQEPSATRGTWTTGDTVALWISALLAAAACTTTPFLAQGGEGLLALPLALPPGVGSVALWLVVAPAATRAPRGSPWVEAGRAATLAATPALVAFALGWVLHERGFVPALAPPLTATLAAPLTLVAVAAGLSVGLRLARRT